MEAWFGGFIEQLEQWHPLWVYSALTLSAVLENVIPPVPGDTVVVFSAYLVGRGVLNLWAVYLSTCVGGMVGFLLMYYLGYSRGRIFLEGRGSRFFTPESKARAEHWLAQYGGALILVNRFLSGIRSVIAIVAGMGGMNWKKVALWGSISMALWNGMLLYLGLLVGQNWSVILEYLNKYNRFLLVVMALAIAVFIGRKWRSRKAV